MTSTRPAGTPTTSSASPSVCHGAAWPTQRILFALAGTATLLGVGLGATASGWFLLLAMAVGINQLLYVAAGACPASLVIDRLRDGTRTTLTDPAEEDTCSSTTTR